MIFFKNILTLILILATGILIAQKYGQSGREDKDLTIKGFVFDVENSKPISNVNIEINNGAYTKTNRAGEFTIKAKIGDELVVRSDDFQTVYYTIKDEQRITIEVEPVSNTQPKSYSQKKIQSQNLFITYLDSAKTVIKKDAKKSINYVTKALESLDTDVVSPLQNSMAFETLGDINLYWGQGDLAVSNYKLSLTYLQKPSTQIKLAKAFRDNNKYQESITLYTKLLDQKLSDYQRVEVYEGLGDTYKAINDVDKSVANYQKGLNLANERIILPKITDLNSKLGTIFAQSGATTEAEAYYGNSLKLAKKENIKRAVLEKDKVADFYNQNRDFDKEIKLREETISGIEVLDEEELVDTNEENNPLTLQRQNYKIATALIAQDKYKEAVKYLKKSIEEAHLKNDLVVEKDATRKLSETYKILGEENKATKNFQEYVSLLDKLYIKKEQELSQAARFNKEITNQQNRILNLEGDRKLNQTRYQLAIKNKELLQKNSLIQKWIIGSLVFVSVLFLFALYTQYKNGKQQKFANNLLALKSLRTQMNPHFIFNALNSVNSFIAVNDERAANRYLSDFSQLMRSVLENSEQDFISLEKEIELLKLYVKLEHFRFKDKFDYTLTIDPKIQLETFVIPPMLLQPYVENAVWHGLRYKKQKGTLTIDFKQVNSETLQITIEDNGIGRKKSKELKTENQKKQRSKGMSNIKKRIAILNKMYQDKVAVTIEDVTKDTEATGTRVKLIIKKDSN